MATNRSQPGRSQIPSHGPSLGGEGWAVNAKHAFAVSDALSASAALVGFLSGDTGNAWDLRKPTSKCVAPAGLLTRHREHRCRPRNRSTSGARRGIKSNGTGMIILAPCGKVKRPLRRRKLSVRHRNHAVQLRDGHHREGRGRSAHVSPPSGRNNCGQFRTNAGFPRFGSISRLLACGERNFSARNRHKTPSDILRFKLPASQEEPSVSCILDAGPAASLRRRG